TDLNEELQETLLVLPDLLNAALGDGLFECDSRLEGFEVQAVHLEPGYNRYTEKGTGAPTDDIHPHFIAKEGVSHVNHGQRVPYVCKEIVEDPVAYEALAAGLTGLCQGLADRLFYHRPQFAKSLTAYVNILPRNAACPFAPFGGVVVNFNACSPPHLDSLDLEKNCVVIPLMKNCQGGGLVLHKARLVLDMHSGDIVLFPSGKFTHFNLHYQGIRASLVFHTDVNSKAWTQMANSW
ncbi:hypothetical protein C8J57DRAFT_1566162, partial [Mycena rebaudengoi]